MPSQPILSLPNQKNIKIPAIMIPGNLNDVSGSSRSHKSLFAKISQKLSQKNPKKPSVPSSLKPTTVRGHDLKSVFRFDEDGDGKISPAELCNCLLSVEEKLSSAEAEAIVESSDSDVDGVLGYDDFVKLVYIEEDEERERTLKEAFLAYEMGGKGCITVSSLRQGLRRLGEERSVSECRVMIQRFDINGDGVICFEEFNKCMML